jgi:phosphonate transport system substrate-binding protein
MMKEANWIALLAAAVLAAGCSQNRTSQAEGEALPNVVIALKPDKNPERMLQEKKALEQYLSQALGRPVQVITPLSGTVIMEGFVNGTVDLGYISATDMISVREKGSVSILLAGEIDGSMTYSSYWVSLKEKPYTSVEDLRGKPVAFASRTSTSGCMVPHADLVQRGLLAEGGDPELFFGRGNVWYGTGYVSAVERVLDGEVEAAAVSDYVLDEENHLRPEQRARLKRVAEQGPVPTHIIAVRTSIPATERELLKNALLALNDPGREELRDKLFTSKLVEADEEAHLAPLREAMRLTGRISR